MKAPPKWSLLERAMNQTVNNPDPMVASAWRSFVLWIAVFAAPLLVWAMWRSR